MIKRIAKRIHNLVWLIILNKKTKSKISLFTLIDKKTEFCGSNIVHKHCDLRGSTIGEMTYLGRDCRLLKSIIGNYCAIAPDVKLIYGKHPTSDFVSIHDLFYSKKGYNGISVCDKDYFDEYDYVDDEQRFFLWIGNDVWIGENARLIGGVSVGDGVIIAAGSLVTKDVPPYAIVAGTPARIIKYRFDMSDIDFLIRNPWWNKGIDWIVNNANCFRDIQSYKTLIESDPSSE